MEIPDRSIYTQKLQSTKAMNYCVLAGILTYSLFFCLPIRWLANSDFKNEKQLLELTAAGQFRIYTLFPFNFRQGEKP
jgi:hypothetical protein